MKPKFVEVPKVDERLVKAKKRITFLLFFSVVSCVLSVVCTAVGFVHYGWLFAALLFEVLTPTAMLLAFKVTMRYKHGGKSKGA